MRSNTLLTQEELEIGCYHELGHILVSMIRLKDYDIAGGIRVSKSDNGAYGLDVPTTLREFPIQKEIHNYALYSIGGGVFQQMKTLYKRQKSGEIDYNDEEVALNIHDSHAAFSHYCHRHVKSRIKEMDGDYQSLSVMERKLLKGGIEINYSYDEITHELIDILSPYVFDKVIDAVCVTCAKQIYNQITTLKPLPYTVEMIILEPILNDCINRLQH